MNENNQIEPNDASFHGLIQDIGFQIASFITSEFNDINLNSYKFKFASNLNYTSILKELTEAISSTRIRVINRISELIDKYNKSSIRKDNNIIILNSLSTDLSDLVKNFKLKIKQYQISNESLKYHLDILQNIIDEYNATDGFAEMSQIFQLKEEMGTIVAQIEEYHNNFIQETTASYEQLNENYQINLNNNLNNDRHDIKVNTSTLLTSQSNLSNSSSSIKTKGKVSSVKIPSKTNKVFTKKASKMCFNTEHISKSIDIPDKKSATLPSMKSSSSFSPIKSTNNDASRSFYKTQYYEQLNEIKKLRQNLLKEQGEKIHLKHDLIKQKSVGNYHYNTNDKPLVKATSKKILHGVLSSNSTCNNSTIKHIKRKLDKITEMILRFSSSMSALHDSIFKNNTNIEQTKLFYNQLKQRLVQISNDFIETKSTIDIVCLPQEPKEAVVYKEDETLVQEKNEMKHLIKENNQLKEKNNSLREYNQQLTEKIITFRNLDGQQCQFHCPTPPMELNDINELKKKFDELLNENKQIKERIISSNSNHVLQDSYLYGNIREELEGKEAELKEAQDKELTLQAKLNTLEFELLHAKDVNKKSITSLSEVIESKDKEINQLESTLELSNDNHNNNNSLLNKLKETHAGNISQLKQLYEKMLNEKGSLITHHIEQCKELKREIISLKELNIQMESKLQETYINHEVELSLANKDIIKLEIEAKELNSKLAMLTVEQESAAQREILNQNHSLGNSLEKLTETIQSKDQTISKLQSSISDLRNRLSTEEENQRNELNKLVNEREALIAKGKEYQDIIESKDKAIKDLKRDCNQLKENYIEELNEKNNEINTISQNHQNDLTELNIAIVKLKSQITKLQEENLNLTYSQRSQRSMQSLLLDISKFNISYQRTACPSIINEENDLLKKEIYDLKNQIALLSNERNTVVVSLSQTNVSCDESNDDINNSGRHNMTSPNIFSMLNNDDNSSNRKVPNNKHQLQSQKLGKFTNKQKEELHVLKGKLRTTLEENKQLNKQIMDLEHTANKLKEEYINVLRAAFEKFLAEIQLSAKAKDYANIVFKMMNYTDDDINDIYSAMGKKKGGSYFGFLRK